MQQSLELKNTGSFFNYLMGNNSSIPEVGKGATELLYTDRHAYEVLSVDEKKKEVVIQRYNPKRTDDLCMSESQKYEYKELVGPKITLVYRWNSWRKKYKTIEFAPQILKHLETNRLTDEMSQIVYDDNADLKLVEGYTVEKTNYDPINIIFGVKEEYYDYSF